MSRALILATTTGYQVRAFREAAHHLGLDPILATDRCMTLDDPWRDAAIPVRFHAERWSLDAIVRAAGDRPIDGVVAVGDRPTVIAARAARALGLPWHSPESARVAGNKPLARELCRDAGLPSPWFRTVSIEIDATRLARELSFPCVIKPLALSGSRGVIRVDDVDQCVAGFARVRRLLRQKDVRALRDAALDEVMVEGFIEGVEIALEAVVERGELRVLALFDKPDPLDGPFFEETIYVTPSRIDAVTQDAVVGVVGHAARSIGLSHGPVHAECRVHEGRVWVLEVAARPIGGLCARALRFAERGAASSAAVSFEELLLRHATGESLEVYVREDQASGVMMIPIPRAGRLRRVSGLDEARAVSGIEDVVITAKPDQHLVPIPEGASYLGFIFARAPTPAAVERALREAHTRLRFEVDPVVPMT